MKSLQEIVENTLTASEENPIHGVSVRRESKSGEIDTASAFFSPYKDSFDSNHSFRIASISKMFTAVLILRLCDRNLIDLDDFAEKHLSPETLQVSKMHLYNGQNQFSQITIRHLLQHKSGLPDYITSEQFLERIFTNPERQWSGREILSWIEEVGLGEGATSLPGAEMSYSDTNYVLLGCIIESILGISLADALTAEIFIPLQMQDSYLEFYQNKRGNNPVFYPNYGEISLAQVNTSFDWGGGGIVSTHKDLHLFIRGLFEGALLTKESLEEMISVESEDEPRFLFGANSSGYGLGIRRLEVNGRVFYGHSGSWGCLLEYEPISQLSISMTINQGLAPNSLSRLFIEVL